MSLDEAQERGASRGEITFSSNRGERKQMRFLRILFLQLRRARTPCFVVERRVLPRAFHRAGWGRAGHVVLSRKV